MERVGHSPHKDTTVALPVTTPAHAYSSSSSFSNSVLDVNEQTGVRDIWGKCAPWRPKPTKQIKKQTDKEDLDGLESM